MNKTLISVAVLAVVIIGGYFIIKGKKPEEAMPVVNSETTTSDQTAQTGEKKVAFSEFIKNGGSYKCDVKQAMSDFDNSGTVYISGANVRGDFSTIAEGKPMKTSFITKDGFSYTWSPDLPNTGFKIKLSNESGANAPTWPSQIGDYNCVAWTADSSMFTVPANITFKEVAGQQ